MIKIDFTNEMIFGFEGPNLCLLGSEIDFQSLSKAILDLTSPNANGSIDITKLDFVEVVGENKKVIFSAKTGGEDFGIIKNDNQVLFELDNRYWERIFIFFALMSWDKKTYYLNSFEDALRDLPLKQECHLICSSEFGSV